MPETTFQQISEHTYWMTPGQPDRPALGAVVGPNATLMIDAGASPAHARLFLEALAAEGIASPKYVALTHWHWDHVFGAAAVGVPIIAQVQTARHLATLSGYAWDNAALDARVATGEEIAFCADDIKVELPEPRTVQIALADIIFERILRLDLGGGVRCVIQHVGGDHAADSCVVAVEPDDVMFLGDCLYEAIYTPARHYTEKNLFPLLDNVLAFDATQFVEGHSDSVLSREEVLSLADKMRFAGKLVAQIGTDESAVMEAAAQQLRHEPDEDTSDFLRAFIAGRTLAQST